MEPKQRQKLDFWGMVIPNSMMGILTIGYTNTLIIGYTNPTIGYINLTTSPIKWKHNGTLDPSTMSSQKRWGIRNVQTIRSHAIRCPFRPSPLWRPTSKQQRFLPNYWRLVNNTHTSEKWKTRISRALPRGGSSSQKHRSGNVENLNKGGI